MKTHIKNLFVLPVLITVLVMSAFGAQAAVVFTTLYSFSGTNDGANPYGLVQGSDGNLYGTTLGSPLAGRSGTLFRISTNGEYTTLHDMGTTQPNGLVQGSDGNLYGTTCGGGTNNAGTVFKISTNGAFTTLYSGGNLAGYRVAGLVQGKDGNFYGTLEGGGSNYCGMVFKFSLNGALTILYSFGSIWDTNGVPLDGAGPNGLVQGHDGSFYGTTSDGGTNDGNGTVFKISTSGGLTSLYSFGWNDGQGPTGLVQGSDGNFYGTTSQGGTNLDFGLGTVFKISTTGALTSLHSFSGNDGAWPNGLVQGSDEYFYGTTSEARVLGVGGRGSVFKISTNGVLTTLHAFGSITDASGIALDGANPNGLVRGNDGSYYGTTSRGGTNDYGTVFRLTIVPEPQLTIVPSGPYMVLTWPTNATGFTLQSTTNLGSPAVWTPVSPGPVVIAGQNAVINTTSGTQQFFRLSQ